MRPLKNPGHDNDAIRNLSGFSAAVLTVAPAFLRDEPGRFVAEVDAIEL